MRHIEKTTLAEIAEQRVGFPRKGGGKQIRATVAVQVLGIHTHVRLRIAGQVDRATVEQGDLLEFAVTEIVKQEIGY